LKLISLKSSFSPSVSQTFRFGFRSKNSYLRPDATLLQVQKGSVRELYAFLPDVTESQEG